MNFAVIVEPSSALDALVLARKRIAAQSWPQAAYLTHPVHCTVIAGVFANDDLWSAPLSERLASLTPFTVRCDAPCVFPNDPVTGGTTVALAVAVDAALSALQRVVAETLAPFRDVATAELLASRFTHADAAASARTYGAPWVGPHWRPHFTIGSFPVAANDAALSPLLAPFTAMTVMVDRVSIWAVRGDVHEHRASVALGEGRR